MGMSAVVPISLVTKWFPKSKGRVTAFIFIGQGIGGLIFPAFSTYYINPKNLVPDQPYSKNFPNEKYFTDEDLLSRVPHLYFMVGIITAALNFTGLLLMFERKNDPELEKIINSEMKKGSEEEPTPLLTLKQALKVTDLYLISFIFCFAGTSISIFTINYKNYGQTFIKDDQFLTLIFTISILVNIPARLLWGSIIDKLSFKLSYLLILTIYMVLTFTVCINEYYGNKYTYMGYYILIDFCKNGSIILAPNISIKRFGHKNIVLINGLMKFFGIPGSIITAAIAPQLLQYFGYFITFSSTNIFPAFSWILLACFNGRNSAGMDI